MNLRFLQRMGVPRPQALAAGAIDDASEAIVQAALFLVYCWSSAGRSTWASSGTPARTRGCSLRFGVASLTVAVVLAVRRCARSFPDVRSAFVGLWR